MPELPMMKQHEWMRKNCLSLENQREKAMAPHSSTLAWKIPWMVEPGRLQSMGLLRVGHDWATSFHFSLSCIGEGNGNPLQCSCLENPRDGGAWWAALYGVAQSRTRLKQLTSSSNKKEWDMNNITFWVDDIGKNRSGGLRLEKLILQCGRYKRQKMIWHWWKGFELFLKYLQRKFS